LYRISKLGWLCNAHAQLLHGAILEDCALRKIRRICIETFRLKLNKVNIAFHYYMCGAFFYNLV